VSGAYLIRRSTARSPPQSAKRGRQMPRAKKAFWPVLAETSATRVRRRGARDPWATRGSVRRPPPPLWKIALPVALFLQVPVAVCRATVECLVLNARIRVAMLRASDGSDEAIAPSAHEVGDRCRRHGGGGLLAIRGVRVLASRGRHWGPDRESRASYGRAMGALRSGRIRQNGGRG
jgi:hypothetical protein